MFYVPYKLIDQLVTLIHEWICSVYSEKNIPFITLWVLVTVMTWIDRII